MSNRLFFLFALLYVLIILPWSILASPPPARELVGLAMIAVTGPVLWTVRVFLRELEIRFDR